ncbi:MAG: glycosyltransferase family 4 protein [Thermoplasmatota archaeon]
MTRPRIALVTRATTLGGLYLLCDNLASELASRGVDARFLAPARAPGIRAPFREIPAAPLAAALALVRDRHDLAHFSPSDLAIPALADKLRGRKVAVYAAGDDVLTKDPKDRAWKARLFRRADAITPISRFTLDALLERFPETPRERVEILYPVVARVPPGADREALAAWGLAPGRYVLTLGNLVARKGFDDFIRVAARVQRAHPAVPFVIGGVGPDRERLERIARDEKADVRFLGAVPPDALPDLYAGASAFALLSRREEYASHTSVEGYGIVLVEAMQHAPILSTRHGGMLDITPAPLLVDGVEDAAERVTALLDSPARRAEWLKLCREKFERDHAPEVVVPKHVALYERLLGRALLG